MDREAPHATGAETTGRCPRCGGGFHCGANDAAPCACGTLTLPPTLQAQLRDRYTGCLCLRCLTELAAAAASDSGVSAAPARAAC